MLLSAHLGDEVSHGAIHRWAQKKGKALRQEEDRRWQAVFEDGEVVEGEGEEKEIMATRVVVIIFFRWAEKITNF